MSVDVLSKLSEILEDRKKSDPQDSYVAQLHQQGLNKILEKLGEESVETLLAARDAEQTGNTEDLVYETADLWFHSLVMLSYLGEDASSVLKELERRFNLSGLEEKRQRDKK
tara:strand:- start:272 stop:607 length:336 start_codon:yes stop_codon:yes gene_type:complete